MASHPTTDDGEHVLWIMGQYHTLPKKMEWRSTELEAAIAGSEELLAEPEVDAGMGTFASWRAAGAGRRAQQPRRAQARGAHAHPALRTLARAKGRVPGL